MKQTSQTSESLEAELRLAARQRELAMDVLAILNEPTVDIEVIRRVIELVKKRTRVEALAIRLRDGENYPYIVADGLSDACLQAGKSLWASHADAALYDTKGRHILIHPFRDVLLGQSDPTRPYFTPGGSFWTNSSGRLVESAAASELRSAIQEHFSAHGYESIALVPVQGGADTLGLLQFSDSRADMFSPEIIRSLEALGGILGMAFAGMRAEEGLRRSKDKLEQRMEQGAAELVKAKKELERRISERKQVEFELKLSQERLTLAMEASNLGSWDWNLNTDEVYFDQRWSKVFGYSQDETETEFAAWQNRIHRDDKLKILKALEDYLARPSRYFETEYRFETQWGEWKWILDRGKVIQRNENGKPTRMAGISLDITDRRRIEDELHETAERFRCVFESARDCICIKNTSLQYTKVNPYFIQLLELPEARILGKTDRELFGAEAADILHEVDRRALNGELVEQEHTRRINGVARTFLDTKIPMRDGKGLIMGIIQISREITDRKRGRTVEPMADTEYRSPAMSITLKSARLASQTDSIVLLTGESGAGKDHLARYIHDNSKRAHGPFFSINCAAVSPELAESELFGYESGAFTGAKGSKRGLLELAEGGSILLNEIGELSLPLQAKLLTFLDTRQFTRVGGVRLFTVSARLLAATNRELEKEVKSRRFRQDLFYRLNVFSIEAPPLRQRIEDLPLLVANILEELAQKMALDFVPQAHSEAMKVFEAYTWPGNVRELRNVLERALIFCDKKPIKGEHLAINTRPKAAANGDEWALTLRFPRDETINDVTMTLKRELCLEALRRSQGRRKRAADLLGISPDSLKHYMQIFNLYS